jgi:quinolinate synthase
MSIKELQDKILDLKEDTDVTILAHYYQELEVQEIADYLGDSLGLSQIASEKADTDNIIFAGVLFMAETASILNQEKHILIPATDAGCPLASYLTPAKIKKSKKEYPNLPVVTYVNTTAAVKAESDICCTSSNSIDIVKRIREEFAVDRVLFGPDNNLAEYAEERSGVNIIRIPGDGHCYVHSNLTVNKIKKTHKDYPDAKVLVHPECIKKVRDYADYIGSTAGMYNYVEDNSNEFNSYIIGTEKGLLDRLAANFPDNTFHLPSKDLICKDMKKNKLSTIKEMLFHLHNDEHQKLKDYIVKVPEDIAKRALRPISRMLEFSK